MGFRNLFAFNQALLAKQIWRLISFPNSMVYSLLICKYFKMGNVLEAKLGPRPSFLWRSIKSSVPLVQEGLFWSIGNGCHTKIWGHKWIPKPSSFLVQAPIKILNFDAYVRELIDNTFASWNYDLIHQIFSLEEANSILGIPLSHFGLNDN